MKNRQGEKTFLPIGQLVFRPVAELLTLLGLVSVCPVEPAGGGDTGWELDGVLERLELVE